ncbi:MAG TPA: ArsI/CadI family heavy metal resistance metalloenzyme [Candidatus Binatus sp.]|nr:ArsI/CadI family heavy metal resistance metalloenzyme [Candidatus Binatus sp.]
MKTHLSLTTHDLDASVAFYRTLLNAEPAKHFDDYALFLTDSPGLELALAVHPRVNPSTDAHFGIAVDDPQLVENAIERLQSAGLPVDIETDETCCYATQNKVWATDPDGRRWETYYVIAESEERESEDMTCCRERGTEDTACCAG